MDIELGRQSSKVQNPQDFGIRIRGIHVTSYMTNMIESRLEEGYIQDVRFICEDTD